MSPSFVLISFPQFSQTFMVLLLERREDGNSHRSTFDQTTLTQLATSTPADSTIIEFDTGLSDRIVRTDREGRTPPEGEASQ